jgi:EAL domain-containing protein (putative c-di-GMP-specific phosphodiesterase class I)
MTSIPTSFVLDAPGASPAPRRRGRRPALHDRGPEPGQAVPLQLRRNLENGGISGAEAVLPSLPARLAGTRERERALHGAAAAALAWDEGPVAVPLTSGELQDGRAAAVAAGLLAAGFPPDRLELALPEAALVGLDEDGLVALAALRDLGIGLVLDGFGAGVASLSVLRQVPLTAMKLARTVVRALPGEGEDMALVRAGIGMAHALGLAVIADGVESEAQRAWLAASGCDEGQGPLFGGAR